MDGLFEKIGERIRILRKSKELSQEELAHQVDLHYTYIGKIERGEKNLSLESLVKITNVLEVSLEEFFSLIDPKDKSTNNIICEEISRKLNKYELEKIQDILTIINDLLEKRTEKR